MERPVVSKCSSLNRDTGLYLSSLRLYLCLVMVSCVVVFYMDTDVSEEHSSSYHVDINLQFASTAQLIPLLTQFDLEEGGNILLRNVGKS
jgi:hypothetical protein